MAVGGGFARDRTQTEALALIEARGLQSPVLPYRCLALAMLEEKLAVIGGRERVFDNGERGAPVYAGALEQGKAGI